MRNIALCAQSQSVVTHNFNPSMRALLYASGLACAVASATNMRAADPKVMSEAIRGGLPKYDPAAHHPLSLPPPKLARRAATPALPAPSTKQDRLNNIVTLPELVVHANADRSSKAMSAPKLPRLATPRPPGQDAPAEAFETPLARDARLVKKHLSPLDRFFLNRYTPFGITKEQRARQAEALEQNARQLNEFAELIEGRTKDKNQTESDQKLREVYYDTYLSRPK